MNNKKDIFDNLRSDDKSLLEVINASYLSIEDINWLKSRRWFKRFLKIYAKELKKRYKNKPVIEKKFDEVKKEDIEVLEFTQTIKMPDEEIIEVLDFTKTIDITNVKDTVEASEIAKKKVILEKRFWSIVIVICVFIFVISSLVLVNWYLENKKTDDMVKEIYEAAEFEEVKVTETTKQSQDKETTTTSSLYDKYSNMSLINVNFSNLKNINSDTEGWVYVPGTEINYPFVRTSDNEYYLKHSFDKSSNKKGWVFLDFRNDFDNLSKNNILYAHGLVNNQMFGSMRRVVKKSWYTNKYNHIIKTATPTNNQLWQVFSVYTIEPESYYITTKFNNDEEFSSFINTLKGRSIYDFGIEVSAGDKILTLSSCYDDKKRMVLHARLISNQAR